jgi:hypothetical protein
MFAKTVITLSPNRRSHLSHSQRCCQGDSFSQADSYSGGFWVSSIDTVCQSCSSSINRSSDT